MELKRRKEKYILLVQWLFAPGFILTLKFLLAIIEKFNGGPVGIDNLAAAVGEDRETLEDVVEPYLIQQGHLQRTPRGRVATISAYRHFGYDAPHIGGQTQELF